MFGVLTPAVDIDCQQRFFVSKIVNRETLNSSNTFVPQTRPLSCSTYLRVILSEIKSTASEKQKQ